jgi:hypothetical protein
METEPMAFSEREGFVDAEQLSKFFPIPTLWFIDQAEKKKLPCLRIETDDGNKYLFVVSKVKEILKKRATKRGEFVDYTESVSQSINNAISGFEKSNASIATMESHLLYVMNTRLPEISNPMQRIINNLVDCNSRIDSLLVVIKKLTSEMNKSLPLNKKFTIKQKKTL